MTSAVESTGATTAPGVPGPALGRLSEMPRVDLMPPEIAAKAALQRLQVGLGVAVFLSVAAVAGLYYQAHGSVTSAKSGLVAAQQDQTQVQAKVNHYSYVAAEYSAVGAAQTEVGEALGGEVLWYQKLNNLAQTIPPNVWLTSMTVTAGGGSSGVLPSGIATITFQGMTLPTPGAGKLARDNVAAWLNSLNQGAIGYENPYATNTPEILFNGQDDDSFTTSVTVDVNALSNRYPLSGS